MIRRSIKRRFVECMTAGMSLPEIAQQLDISIATAKFISRELLAEIVSGLERMR